MERSQISCFYDLHVLCSLFTSDSICWQDDFVSVYLQLLSILLNCRDKTQKYEGISLKNYLMEDEPWILGTCQTILKIRNHTGWIRFSKFMVYLKMTETRKAIPIKVLKCLGELDILWLMTEIMKF